MLSPELETERLLLRRYKESDIDMLYKILSDDRLTKYTNFPKYTRLEELQLIKKWINNADNSKYEKWVIVLKDDNTPIGTISVNGMDEYNNYCNIGYVILYDYWGNGYTAEALEKVSDYLLDSGYRLIECSCNELNVQSSRVMEKAGFKKDGYIKNRRLNKDGSYSGSEFYSKVR